MQRLAVAVAHDVVGVGDDRRELRDQVDRLAHQVVARGVVGVFVEGVHLQYAAREDVHHVRSFQVEDVHLGLLAQRHEGVNQALERFELFAVGQVARQQQEGRFFEPEAIFPVDAFHQVVHVDAAVKQPAGDRLEAFGQAFIADHVADLRQSHQHARMVFVAQPPLDVVFREEFVVDAARAFDRLRKLVDDVLLFHKPQLICVCSL